MTKTSLVVLGAHLCFETKGRSVLKSDILSSREYKYQQLFFRLVTVNLF
jgi:hypothetical protein